MKLYEKIAGFLLLPIASILVLLFTSCNVMEEYFEESLGLLPYKKVGTETIEGNDYEIVTFGEFPQSRKRDDVRIVSSNPEIKNGLNYYRGDDDERYVKFGNEFYKVEPIRWRILTGRYDYSERKLLLAESILSGCEYYPYAGERVISSNIVGKSNYEHSKIRAYLNGLSYQKRENLSADQQEDDTFLGKGFYQQAFSDYEKMHIVTKEVQGCRNSVFLLSLDDATEEDYGFAPAGNEDVHRIRRPTDYAAAMGITLSIFEERGCNWFLSNPRDSMGAYGIDDCGKVSDEHLVFPLGVVPAVYVER
ncbi:MAG: hypothetical protein J6Y30_09805 [Treponema sp.]|nr:hypothetical protein [Treponema sp.]MBP5438263.1 hypothetical protein [Treponema sp.]